MFRNTAGLAFSAQPVLFASVSSHDSHPPIEPDAVCLNCSTPLAGPFCAQCGQHAIDYHRGFHHLFHDLLENLFHFEGKFFVTVAWLLAKPGRITMEFLAGRRASQLNPLRFYIFVSVLFFLGISLLNHGHLIDIPRKDVDDLQLSLSDQGRKARTLEASDFSEEEKAELTRQLKYAVTHGQKVDREAVIDAIRRARPAVVVKTDANESLPNSPKKPVKSVRLDRSSGLGQLLSDKLGAGELKVSDIWAALEHRVPSLLFLGVPLFALLLKLFYLRSDRYYVEHLIFSLHLHTWAFLVFMIGNGYLKLASIGPSWLDTLFAWVLFLWAVWYLFRSFRVVYGQSRFKTALKIGLLGFTHAFLLLMVAVALALGTLAWLAYE